MKSRPPCLEWREKLALRHEDLSPSEQQALDAHVKTCDACASALADYHFFEARLDALPPPSIKPLPRLSPQFFEQHPRRLPQGERATFATPARRIMYQARESRGARLIWRTLSVAAVLALLLAAMLIFRLVSLSNLAAHPGGGTLLNLDQHKGGVMGVAWSPDGKYIATASEDHTVKIWNAQSGALVCTYTGHSDAVYALAWAPQGNLIASGGGDNTVQKIGRAHV